MATFTNAALADKMMRATPEDRRKIAQDVAKGLIKVTDETGRVLDFTPPPDRLGPSPLPPFPVRDRSGNIVQEAASASETKAPPIKKGFTLKNRQSFEEEIQHEPEATRASLRLQYDTLRKQHGID